MKQLALFLSVVALVASGCAGNGGNEPVTTVKHNQEDPRFVPMDKAVQQSVTCTQIQLGRTADGRTRVSANLRNQENRRLEVQANCQFKDAQGFTLESTPFQTVFLDENATETISFESINKDATNYTIRVRQAR
jgi:uncharacterized protein YcfL